MRRNEANCLTFTVIAGNHSVFYGPEAHGVMVIYYPDAWWALTGLAPRALRNQMLDARSDLPAALPASCERIREGGRFRQLCSHLL
ncbi:hypothetical protein B9Z45_15265 [Limnohabitans sp. 2KL-17]|nr:hypothetical protein B9Z45_15265 [Limnohabitans sp. 2KL-17]